MLRMKKTALLLVLAVVIGISLFARGIQDNPAPVDPSRETINIGSTNEPTSLSTIEGGSSGITEAFSGNVYESLFKLTDDGRLENLLASSYTKSTDGLTYTITLREGVKFHSGKTLTSADIRASFEWVTAENALGARKSSYQIPESV